ncbi:carbohydrate esterase family 16 protein [Pholiota conissans]|uniref:Carbohydrate esterase family 16 protein n=1 Tax=Pholiota conissans TaxID=109636 RepID=A0A9P5YYC2_9AGAR|nr:carbohydrate esterase family 16 protein [Pholiota conissans]
MGCLNLALLAIFCAISSYARNPLSSSQITAFVPFGDSYTDTFSPSNGGTAWPVYAVGYAGKNVGLFPYARSGATCSNNLTFRPFPSLFESQLPLWEQEKANGTLEYLKGPKARNQENALYFLWIGTNDVGDNGLLTGHEAPGVSLVDVAQCMVDWVKIVYENGGRNFMFANMLPLQRTPLYSAESYLNHYWTAVRNTTEWNVVMNELVLTGNELTKLQLQAILPTIHGAHLGIFDAHGLFNDMLDRPSLYLNGTAPLNTTGAVKSCIYQLNEPTSDTGDCTIAQGTDRDSFTWFDELHPSEQSDRIVAREVAKVIKGEESEWMKWLS